MSGDLKERIEQMLAGLGDTPEAVADRLRGDDITGSRGDGCWCPVANLIRSRFPEAADDDAWGDSVDDRWFVDIRGVQTPAGLVPAPAPVAGFIELFDDGDEFGVRQFDDLDDMRGDL